LEAQKLRDLRIREGDVRITLRVTSIVLPLTAGKGPMKALDDPVGRYVGSEEGFLKNKERR
jgi:hypothetical protein